MRITMANHAHVFPEAVRANGSIETLLALMDSCEIERAVAFAPFPTQMEGDPNAWLASALKGRKELVGFGTIDFGNPDLEDQVKKARDLGFLGLKLHPSFQGFQILGQSALTVYKWAERLGLFLSFHTGVHWGPLKNDRLIDYDEITFLFPELKFSLEHVGGYHFFPEALAVICNHKDGNVFAGMTSVYKKETHPLWYLSPERIEEIIMQAGPEQLIFGLDFPYNQTPEILETKKLISSMGLTAEVEQKLLGENLKVALDLAL